MKNLFYCTKKNVYLITKNDNGTVTFFPEEENAGAIIMQRGGISKFLASCIEDYRSYDEFSKDIQLIKHKQREYRAEMRLQNANAEKAAIANAYNAMLANYGMSIGNIDNSIAIDVTMYNLYALMRYLRTIPQSQWQLPALSQGYTANQYDCAGQIAVTITLKEGIHSDDKKIINKLQYGAPMGHLTNYTNIGRL